MSSFFRRTLIFAAATLLLSYIYFFVFNILTYPGEQLITLYRISWIFEEALRMMIAYMPTLLVTSVIAAFATLPGTGTEISFELSDISGSFGKLMLLFIAFIVLYTGLHIGLQPKLYRDRHDRLYRSSLAEDYLEKAEEAEKSEELEEALRYFRNYLSIVGENRPVERRIEMLEGEISSLRGEAEREKPQPQPKSRKETYRNLTAAELVEMSRNAMEEDDPFTAHFMAQMALELDESREDAKRLAAQAWEQIGRKEPDREKKKEHRIYKTKVRGYNALQQGDPVQAYYIFKELYREKPEDPDIQDYLRESRLQARKVSFFIEEAQDTDTSPGIQTIVYIEPGDNPATTLIHIGKMVLDGAIAWLHDVEILSFTEEGQPVRHLKADYAKLSYRVPKVEVQEPHSVFIFRGIGRESREETMMPTVTYGAGFEGELPSSGGTAAPENIYRTEATLSDLSRMSMHRDFLHRLNLLDLFSLEGTFDEYHHPRTYVQLTILMRLLGPFLLLSLSIFAVGLGLRMRPRQEKVPPLLYPSLLLLPFVLQRIVSMYEYAHRLVFAGLLRSVGFSMSLIVFLILQALLLFAAIFFTARYREHNE